MKFSKEEVLKILEGAKDEQGNVPFVIVKKAIEKLKVEPEWIHFEKEKPNEIQEYENKQLIDELAQMPSMVIATAYLHAINYALYGEDVTEKWATATQNANALEKAYRKGYYDALQNTDRKQGRRMKIEFTKDFARNWKSGEIVEAKYLGMGEILVDNVAKIDAKQLLKHCKIVSESDDEEWE